MSLQLENKIALIVGGGTGIGLSTAAAFAKEGAHVIISGRREDKLREACVQIGATPAVRYFAADISDREQANRLVDWVLGECGRIDILVHNAGVNILKRSSDDMEPEGWDHVMNINATGAFNVVHAVLPGMKERGDGVIICTSSVAGCRPNPLGGVAYTASKHALTAMARVISEEQKDSGIRVSVVSPGEVNTPILDERPVPVSDEHRARILQPEDVAAAILFIATLPPRAHITDLVIKPTIQSFQ